MKLVAVLLLLLGFAAWDRARGFDDGGKNGFSKVFLFSLWLLFLRKYIMMSIDLSS